MADGHISEKTGILDQLFTGGKYAEWSHDSGATADLYEQMKALLGNAEQEAQARINNAYEANRKLQDDFSTAASDAMMAVAQKGALVRRGSNLDTLDTSDQLSDMQEDIASIESTVDQAEQYAEEMESGDNTNLDDLLEEGNLDGQSGSSTLGGDSSRTDGKLTNADIEKLSRAVTSYDAGYSGIGANISYMGEKTQEAQAKNIQDVANYYDAIAKNTFSEEQLLEQLKRIEAIGDAEKTQTNMEIGKGILDVAVSITALVFGLPI